MIVFDIDDTISPTRPPKDWAEPHETKRAWAFTVRIPNYVLDFLRTRDDIALLSTWKEAAKHIAEEFQFTAEIIVLNDNQHGIKGKYEIINSRTDITAWVDDQITPTMAKDLKNQGIITIRPKKGVISEKEITTLRAL